MAAWNSKDKAAVLADAMAPEEQGAAANQMQDLAEINEYGELLPPYYTFPGWNWLKRKLGIK